MHLVGFTIDIYYDARPYERQKRQFTLDDELPITFNAEFWNK